jgi:hypothetical protein
MAEEWETALAGLPPAIRRAWGSQGLLDPVVVEAYFDVSLDTITGEASVEAEAAQAHWSSLTRAAQVMARQRRRRLARAVPWGCHWSSVPPPSLTPSLQQGGRGVFASRSNGVVGGVGGVLASRKGGCKEWSWGASRQLSWAWPRRDKTLFCRRGVRAAQSSQSSAGRASRCPTWSSTRRCRRDGVKGSASGSR